VYYFWDYWQLYQKVTFDGVAKIITVNEGVTSLDIRTELYSAWVNWLSVGESTHFLNAMRYTGLDPIPTGFTGDTYFLINGWKLYIDITKVSVTGVLYSDNYPTAFFDYSGNPQYPMVVSSVINTVTILQNVITDNAASIAAATRVELTPELNKINTLENGLTPNQLTMLQEIYALYGLDPTKPLLVTDTQRQAGTINQTITTTPTQTTVQRV